MTHDGIPLRSSRRHLIGSAAVAAGGLALSRPALAQDGTPETSPASGEWSFTDDKGVTVTLPARPERIVIDVNAAAPLWDYGIRPVAVFGWNAVDDAAEIGDFGDGGGNVDPSTVEIVGNVAEPIRPEEVVAVDPDLIITLTFTLGDDPEEYWSIAPEVLPQVQGIAPIIGMSSIGTADVNTARFAELAGALGADLETPELVAERERYDAAVESFEALATEQSEISVLFIGITAETAYVANAALAADLALYQGLGMNVIVPENPEGYWEQISLEQALLYPADILMQSTRPGNLTAEELQAHPSFGAHPAVAAGQIGAWNQDFIQSHRGMADALEAMLPLLTEAEDVTGSPPSPARSDMAITGAAPAPRTTTAPTSSTRAISFRLTGLVIGVVVVCVAALMSLRFGSVPIATRTAWDAIFAHDPTVYDQTLVRQFRVPRTLIALSVGGALAVAGAVMQGITRNPLADPTILGVSSGASFAITIATYAFGITTADGYVGFAFVGAIAAAVLVFAIGSAGRGGATPVRLALAGVVVSALLGAWSSTILLLSEETMDTVRFWLAGSVAGRDLATLWTVTPLLWGGVLVALFLGHQLNVLSMGEDQARALGMRTGRTRLIAGVAVVLITAAAVSVAGPIGFVGLAVPHMVRSVIGNDYRWVLPYCLVVGAVVLTLADTLGRVAARPADLQVGIVTALVGAPFLIVLARRRTVAS